ncbi:hypothetical protein MMC07_001950 [Pseudocyphellaria aurata]|nr:hypothetical protein [Pseudocyphellaria aurata]
MSSEGALEPPPGITPNFVDPISLRKYDVFGQTAGLIGYVVISFEADKYGSGVHMWNVTKQDVVEYAKLVNASQILYGPLIFVTKLSILLLYLRVFIPSWKSKTFIFIHLLLWTNLSFYLVNTFIKVFECTPRSKIWMPTTPGHCVNIDTLVLVAASVNVVSDFTLLILPVASVWNLQMGRKQKLGVSLVFAAGIFGCVSSVMRLIITVQNSNVEDRTFAWFGEFLWTCVLSSELMWATLIDTRSAEITSGIVCSCFPVLPSFIRHFYRKAATKLSKDRERHNDNSALFSYHESPVQSPVVGTTSNLWSDPDDSQLLQRTYLELLERSIWDSWDSEDIPRAPDAAMTTATRGGSEESQEAIPMPAGLRYKMKDIEHGGMQSGIMKTVTIAQYPKPIASVV